MFISWIIRECCLSQCTIRQQPHARAVRVDTWEGDGDEVLEEEARLVGMPPLEAHNSLEDAMHPH